MSHLKRTFTKSSGCCVSHMDYKPGVSTTQMMSLSRESRSHSINKSYIPMRAVNGNKSWVRIVDGNKPYCCCFNGTCILLGVYSSEGTDKLKLVPDGQSNVIILKYILSHYQRILEAVYKTPIGQPLQLDPLEYLPPPKERSLQFRIRKHYRR